MILFFYGSNEYLLTRKLRELKERYRQTSNGNFDLINLDGADLTFEKFTAQVQTMALFASTRLVIIENIFNAPKDVLDKIKDYLDKINGSTVVVFTHRGDPDKRLGLFKALNKPKISQNFKEFSELEISRFILSEVGEQKGKISKEAAAYLTRVVGNNPWQLHNEIGKLTTYCQDREITRDDIDLFVNQNILSNVFGMIDHLLIKDKAGALVELDKLLLTNEPPIRILGAINYQFRIFAQIVDEKSSASNPFELSKKLGLQYFQVKKSYDAAKNTSIGDVSRAYSLLVNCDEMIKTGKIEPAEGLKELVLSF